MQGSVDRFQTLLLAWYDRHRRDLPWRVRPGSPPDARPPAYHVLLSELMLQQTQVATVVAYFNRFTARWPTIADLAAADEQEVLRLWQGLGYYNRARNLLKAARAVVNDRAGRVPDTLDGLQSLPGVGRYTAGAIASIAHGVKAPILDGNVARVVARLDAIREDVKSKPVVDRLWQRAEELVPASRPGDFNQALMELGATVCTPRSPKCLLCPVADFCRARELGLQEKIPPPREAKETPQERRITVLLRDASDAAAPRYLIEQRPPDGRWASMWQFVTLVDDDKPVTATKLARRLGTKLSKLRELGVVEHQLTHRRYTIRAHAADLAGPPPPAGDAPRAWVTADELDRYPLPKPHLRIWHLATRMTEDETNHR
jgi:A/G-specific adenine glycosylase